MSVKAQSTISLASVKTVNDASQFAVQQAGIAKASADSATASASTALTQLSVVENVVGVLDLLSTHGTYALTSDTKVQEGKWYFSRSGSGTSADPYTYEVVNLPVGSNPTGYYELVSIDQAVTNYVSSHLALTNEGLWLQQDGSNYRLLLNSSGLDIRNGSDSLANYSTSVRIGKDDYGHVEINDDGMVVWGEQDGSTTSGSGSYFGSNIVSIGTGAETSMLTFGALGTTLGSSRQGNLTLTEFRTNTSGASNPSEVAQANITAYSSDMTRDAHISVYLNERADETRFDINADRIEWNGNEIPMVIEQGTSNGWTYRKWSDGTAECWQLMAQKNYAMTNPYGSSYYSAVNPFCTFPSGLFTSAPILQITRTNTSSGAGLVSVSVSAMTQTSANAYVFSTQSQTLSVGFSLYAVGKWN